ncbi:EAL domain-containing protein [Frankia sp. AgPm24]|uniref:putative bifunctional diguanylate cyclase/phosphodiesterase n=1 Tax=Frankia sp. AgPm24 TaxID=631128 RepID=UPI00200CC1AA|nr:EAL domain-containing protein [Frankia sp. AgPm24]MCK9921898.1 EAL domain-containing protein [Frankia sp. AgPm24]
MDRTQTATAVRAQGVDGFARAWARAIAGASFPDAPRVDVERWLHGLSERLVDIVLREPFVARDAADIAAALLEHTYGASDVLAATIEVCGTHLRTALESAPGPELTDRIAALQGAFARGYTHALRERILADQDLIHRAARRATTERVQLIFSAPTVGIVVADESGRIQDSNDAFARMVGVSRARVIGRSLPDFAHPDDAARLAAALADQRRGPATRPHGETRLRSETRLGGPDGGVVRAELSTSCQFSGGRCEVQLTLVTDVTDRHQFQESLRYQARHDALTGLPNRIALGERVDELTARGQSRRIGLCFVDLDRFKAVNDDLGHEVGDRLLVAVSARLRATLTDGQMLVRMGGDEFVLLLADTTGIEDVTAVAARVLAALAEPILLGSHVLTVGASLGLVESEVLEGDFDDLMQAADRSLYRAKDAGRGRWVVFDADHDSGQANRHVLAPMLASAVRDDEFVVHYQPIVALGPGRTRSMVGAEALVRWRHPRFGLLPPEMFLGSAENNGQIAALGRRVLELACAEAARWRIDHPGYARYVSVNLSVGQVRAPGLVDEVDRILVATGLPADLLQLEFSEAMLLGPTGDVTRVLGDLAERGVRLALDDFGTGYAHLARLHRLPLHTLKLAGPLVIRDGDAAADPGTATTLHALVALGHALGLIVTAEGVETENQVERLRRARCDAAQGYLFARPLPPERLRAWLSSEALLAPAQSGS